VSRCFDVKDLKVPGMNPLCHQHQLQDGYRPRACGDFKDGAL
jgi:hypothetical protein